MISLKPGVRLLGLSPQMVFAHMVVYSVWQDRGYSTPLTVTSGSDGNHTNVPRPSGHYTGNALDYRTSTLFAEKGPVPQRNDNLAELRDTLRVALGPDFLVLMEDVNSLNEHLHVEWLPKRVT